MTMTQREYDIRQTESELNMKRRFEEWRTAFLGDRIDPLSGPGWQPSPPGLIPPGAVPPGEQPTEVPQTRGQPPELEGEF